MMENHDTKELSFNDVVLVIKDWLLYFKSKFKFIFLAGLIGAALGLTYSFMKKPEYVAKLTFALEDEKSGGMSGALGLASGLGFDVGSGSGGVFAGANLIELFKSRNMVEKALLETVNSEGKSSSLVQMYIRDNNLEKGNVSAKLFMPNVKREKFTRFQDSILGVIYENLSKSNLSVFQEDKKVSIITVEVRSINEVFSKEFTESLAQVVTDFYKSSKSEKARMNMEVLQRQLDSIRGELNNSLTGVAVSNDKTFGLNPALNVKRVPSARKQVDVQTNTATLGELVKQTELAKVTVRKETPLIQVIDAPIYPLKIEKFGKIKGVILGGFLFGFFAIVFFATKRFYNIYIK